MDLIFKISGTLKMNVWKEIPIKSLKTLCSKEQNWMDDRLVFNKIINV